MKIIDTLTLKRLLIAGITLASLTGATMPAQAHEPLRGQLTDSVFGDLHLPMYCWSQGITDPSALIVAIHGGCLHGGTYKPLAEALAQKNVIVISTDLRGYGKWYYENFGTKSDKSFHYKQSKRDLAAIVGKLRETYPGVPIYFIGESLGANLSLHMIGQYKHLADGAILCSTYSMPRFFFQPFMVASAFQFMAKPFGKLTMVPYIKARLSDTKAFSLQHINDPMGLDHQSLKQMVQSMMVNRHGKYYATQVPADTAILMMHGQYDKLCAINSTKKLFAKIPAQDKTFAVIPKRGHLLVETPEMRPEVMQVLNDWLAHHSRSVQYQHALSEPHKVGQADTTNTESEVQLN